jgi:hypothetical protein
VNPDERWRVAVEMERELLRLQAAMRAAQTDEEHTAAETALYEHLERQDRMMHGKTNEV